VKGDIVKRDQIDGATRAEMYALFAHQFDGVPEADFLRDLDEKNWVLLLRKEEGQLAGFSSLHVYKAEIGERELTVVYSGDTVVDIDTWRDSALSYYWMGAVDFLQQYYETDRLYWFLLVSGYRTYRFLPVYSEFFYPRFDRPTPPDVQEIMDTLALARFGDRYDPNTGIVKLRAPARLKGELGGIPENRLSDPHIAYFARRNPGHEQGDELVCFSILAEDKLTRLGKRMWRKGCRLMADSAAG
jgi:hypothetical protein